MALPVNGSTHLIPVCYSIYRPRKDERLTWPSWLTYSGWLTHISGHPSAAGRAQDRESSPTRDRRSTTVPRHQLRWYACLTTVTHPGTYRARRRVTLLIVAVPGPRSIQSISPARRAHSSKLATSFASFAQYLTTILQLSYNNAKVTTDLGRMCNLQDIL